MKIINLSFLLFLICCSDSEYDAEILVGNWWFCDNTGYNEVSVDSKHFHFCSSNMGLMIPVPYTIEEDSLFFYSNKDQKKTDASQILKVSKDSLIIVDRNGQEINLYRMDNQESSVNSKLRQENIDKFWQLFSERELKSPCSGLSN